MVGAVSKDSERSKARRSEANNNLPEAMHNFTIVVPRCKHVEGRSRKQINERKGQMQNKESARAQVQGIDNVLNTRSWFTAA
jgi:hypothetical protein